MPSGGARFRSGPAPDPNALRRDRDGDFEVLPPSFDGDVPEFPLAAPSGAELVLWDELWTKPQGVLWARLGLKFQVAAYVRAFLESVDPGASAGLKTAVLRMEGELALSTPGLKGLRLSIADSEPEHDAVVTQLRPVESDLAALLDDD